MSRRAGGGGGNGSPGQGLGPGEGQVNSQMKGWLEATPSPLLPIGAILEASQRPSRATTVPAGPPRAFPAHRPSMRATSAHRPSFFDLAPVRWFLIYFGFVFYFVYCFSFFNLSVLLLETIESIFKIIEPNIPTRVHFYFCNPEFAGFLKIRRFSHSLYYRTLLSGFLS